MWIIFNNAFLENGNSYFKGDMEMKNITFKSLVILSSAVLLSALLFSMVSCAKKKPPEPVVQKPAVSAEDEARKRVEEETRKKAEEEKKKAEEEAARAKAEEIKKKAEDEAKRKAEEEARLKAEEFAKAKVGEDAKAREAVKEPEVVKKGEGKTNHEVVKGECLWKIAKYKDVYGNPFMWPIIYKANHDKITDPDLVYPKQVLSIPREFSSDDKDKATHHAKHRGEWSLHDGPEKYWEPSYKKK